jgi:hypothetical protein
LIKVVDAKTGNNNKLSGTQANKNIFDAKGVEDCQIQV